VTCAAGQFASQIASNVARMCGSAQNDACSVSLPQRHSNSAPASTLNDSILNNFASTVVTDGQNPFTFMIDLEQTRNIQYVRVFNCADCCQEAQVRIGLSTCWTNNPVCAGENLDMNMDQIRLCNLSG